MALAGACSACTNSHRSIGLEPLFLPCSKFDQTEDLFKRWLMYGIGTIFSMAQLSVVASMVLDLTVKISEALWGAKIVNSILGNSTEGLTSTAMQQGGIGLLLSILVVSVPPMAAMFFQGTLGSALTYSVFTPTGGRPGPQGQPAGSWGGGHLAHSQTAALGDRQNTTAGTFSDRVVTGQGAALPQNEGVRQGSSVVRPQQ